MKYYTGVLTTVCGADAAVSRTGYTGEDGCELIVPGGTAVKLWLALLKHGSEFGILPAGLGAAIRFGWKPVCHCTGTS